MNEIHVYGAQWCAESNELRRHLEFLGVPYRFHDIDDEESAAGRVERWNAGARKIPTVALLSEDEESVLTVPSKAELNEQLALRGLLPIPATKERRPRI